MARRRIVRRTLGKDPIKKALSILGNIGPATNPNFELVIAEVAAGTRDSSGATKNIREGGDTAATCNVGDIIKYVNLVIQCGARDASAPEDDTSGWLEWAVVKSKENRVVPQTTNLGTMTLGVVCTNAFRGDCILTGNLPVGGDQPNTVDIQIKIPKIFCKMQIGSSLTLYMHYRSTNAASLDTDLVRIIASAHYKLYV